jgi:hypothetical protein
LPDSPNSTTFAEHQEAVVLRRFHHLAAIAAVVISAAAPAHAADFLAAIDDVTSAEGQVGATEISAFYIASLPALGWKRVEGDASLAFERENERLSIMTREPANSRPVTVSFELIVKLASTRLPE